MKRSLGTIISLVCLAAAVIASFYFYAHFPDVVATHWGLDGKPNGYSSRAFAAFFFPALNIALFLILTFIPRIDPRRERYQEFAKAYSIFKTMIVIFLTAVYFIVGLNALGYVIAVETIVPALMGILFIVLGNYMGKIRNNWFFGIRTPWTLSSEEVWNKTHRLSGRIFVLGGIVMIISLIGSPVVRFGTLIAVIVAIVLIPTIYSYFVYKTRQTQG